MLPPRTVVAYLSFALGQDARGTHLILHSFDRHNDSKANNNPPKSSETAEKQGRDSQKASQQSQRGERANLESFKGRQARRRSNNRVGVGAIESQPAPPAPPNTTRIRLTTTKKYILNSAKVSQACA
jgi:hypothetical protein